MGTTKKIKVNKRISKREVTIVTTKPDDLTDTQWNRFNSGEELFPEKLAKANEMLAKTKFMDEQSRIKLR